MHRWFIDFNRIILLVMVLIHAFVSYLIFYFYKNLSLICYWMILMSTSKHGQYTQIDFWRFFKKRVKSIDFRSRVGFVAFGFVLLCQFIVFRPHWRKKITILATSHDINYFQCTFCFCFSTFSSLFFMPKVKYSDLKFSTHSIHSQLNELLQNHSFAKLLIGGMFFGILVFMLKCSEFGTFRKRVSETDRNKIIGNQRKKFIYGKSILNSKNRNDMKSLESIKTHGHGHSVFLFFFCWTFSSTFVRLFSMPKLKYSLSDIKVFNAINSFTLQKLLRNHLVAKLLRSNVHWNSCWNAMDSWFPGKVRMKADRNKNIISLEIKGKNSYLIPYWIQRIIQNHWNRRKIIDIIF